MGPGQGFAFWEQNAEAGKRLLEVLRTLLLVDLLPLGHIPLKVHVLEQPPDRRD
jgi:hypothetical protein